MPDVSERPSLDDVARRAHVGRTTASDALSGASRVHDDTRARVLAAASELRYRADPAGIRFRRAAVTNVGALIPGQTTESMEVGSGTLWSWIVMALGQALGSRDATLTIVDSVAQFQACPMPVHAFVAMDGVGANPLVPRLPFGAPVWIADPQTSLADGHASITYDYAAIAHDALDFIVKTARTNRVEMWSRVSVDVAPLTASVTNAVISQAAARGIDLTLRDVVPDAQGMSAAVDAHRSSSRRHDSVMCWGLDPSHLRLLMDDATVLSFGEGIFESNMHPLIPYLAFDLPSAGNAVAAEVTRCISTGSGPRDIVLTHRLHTR